MSVKTYAADQITIVFGPVVMSGFSPDQVVTVEQNEDSYTLQVGADGHATRSKNSNESGRVTVPLAQSSMTNDLLSAIAEADRVSGQGVFPLMVKDGSGRSIHVAEAAWIVRPPSAAYGSEAGQRDWVFESGKLKSHIGGN